MGRVRHLVLVSPGDTGRADKPEHIYYSWVLSLSYPPDHPGRRTPGTAYAESTDRDTTSLRIQRKPPSSNA
jgi:hypothetical protein